MTGILSFQLINRVTTKIKNKAKIKIAKALFTAFLPILRLKLQYRFSRATMTKLSVKQPQKVVVFTPPPVEVGDAPININIIKNRRELSVIFQW
jgi:hypothetical protein